MGDRPAAPPFGGDGPPLNIVLVHPEIPQNTGNIGRLCVGTGCHLHLIEPLGFQIDEKAVRRAGLDYWKQVPLTVYPDLGAFFAARGPEDRFWVMSARQGRPFTAAPFRRGDFVLFGRESTGLPEAVLAAPPGPGLRIPHGDGIRSLNLSNAVAVLVFEALKQLHPEAMPGPEAVG